MYPHRGVSFFARSEYAVGTTSFSQHVVRVRFAKPIVPHVTVLTDAAVGAATRGDPVPLHRRFQLGGAYPSVLFPDRQVGFVGLRPVEEFGTSVVRAGAAIQWEMRKETFVTFRSNTGYAGSPLTIDHTRYHTGFGLSLGSLTPFVRYEHTSLDPQDNYFRTQLAGRSYKRSVVGARYALDSRSSLKFELSQTNEAQSLLLDDNGIATPWPGGSFRRASLQYSIAF